nr:P-loop containing nucleoside triphosphate hydrolase protein [Hypoxylon argillaceum]KAI1154105.1 P-loop containing nucleoside triphosphate hydrolase protein [Nemania diffusa]
MAASFVPRTLFEASANITRTYYIGHHKSALVGIKQMISNVGLVLECRDSRVPLTSANELFESTLAGRDRIVVYTKCDLCTTTGPRWFEEQRHLLAQWNAPVGSASGTGRRPDIAFTHDRNPRLVSRLFDAIKERAAAHDSPLGLRVLVVGMPNTGKSSLLNALRLQGMGLPKAARTGSNPGVTRKMGGPVRILAAGSDHSAVPSLSPPARPAFFADRDEPPPDYGGGVYVYDTPGVFTPYAETVEEMLKLALVGSVKDGIIPAETLADYLLFNLNLRDPSLYGALCEPTNDVERFLGAVAVRTGKLLKGGVPSTEHAADWIVNQWRAGDLGRFALDDTSERALAERARRRQDPHWQRPLSLNQARNREKDERKARNAAKRATAKSAG